VSSGFIGRFPNAAVVEGNFSRRGARTGDTRPLGGTAVPLPAAGATAGVRVTRAGRAGDGL